MCKNFVKNKAAEPNEIRCSKGYGLLKHTRRTTLVLAGKMRTNLAAVLARNCTRVACSAANKDGSNTRHHFIDQAYKYKSFFKLLDRKRQAKKKKLSITERFPVTKHL